MIELTRSVRFCLNDPAELATGGPARHGRAGAKANPHNSFSAWPAMSGLGRYYQLRVTCRGAADPVTGYFLNIKQIDRAVRQRALPLLARALASKSGKPNPETGTLMRRLFLAVQEGLTVNVAALQLDLTPFHSLRIGSQDMDHVILTQQFEFSAAHRLHVASMSAQANRRFFGKCNSPSGHGHNYRLEVRVRVPISPQGRILPLEQLDALVDRRVIQKLDHKNLNSDVAEFARLNPTVENIAAVIYHMLDSAVGKAGAKLDAVSVWETSKTQCTYREEEGSRV